MHFQPTVRAFRAIRCSDQEKGGHIVRAVPSSELICGYFLVSALGSTFHWESNEFSWWTIKFLILFPSFVSYYWSSSLHSYGFPHLLETVCLVCSDICLLDMRSKILLLATVVSRTCSVGDYCRTFSCCCNACLGGDDSNPSTMSWTAPAWHSSSFPPDSST